MGIALPLTSPEQAARYRKMGLWHDKTFYEFFAASAARHPGKTAIIEGTRRITYAELSALINNVAGNLLDLGLRPGDIVSLQTRNSHVMPLVHLACNRIGLLYMPLHDTWRDVEVKHLLKRSGAKVVIVPVEYRGFNHVQMISGIRGELPDLQHVFTLEGTAPGTRAFDELLRPTKRHKAELDARRPDPDLPAHTMLSGGTTALSKISRFTCNDLVVMLDNFVRTAEFTDNDIIAALAPAGTGATGYVFPILTPLLHGATSVILERWGGNVPEAVELLRREKCTCSVAIPTQLTLMIPELEKYKPSDFPHYRLAYNAGAALPYDTGLKMEQLTDCVIQSMYGTTDGGVPTVTALKDPQEKRLSTVGKVVPGCECELWGPEGKPVPKGEQGEIVWRGADKCYGYLGDDEQTAMHFTKDHFYKSGDLGQFDAEGYLRVTGRVKDMILRGGRNISPLTIEEQLIKHPAVVDVSVTSMPDPILGERACAFVMLKPDASLGFEEAVDFLKAQHLAVWQLPERLEIIDDFPRGPGGKILKGALTKLVTEKLKAEGKIPA
ncbi:MAG: AMP-binding protein [Betaproteobacteria bacterium]|nr:AMP-binding protein [Betaproteobacteria bacterium]